MNEALKEALLSTIHAENIARHEANAAEPYVHATYADHEQRIYRLVDALADGNEELAQRFNDALFDITFDGLAWMRKVWSDLRAEVGYRKAAQDIREGDTLIDWGLVVNVHHRERVEIAYQDDYGVDAFDTSYDEMLAVSY
jgi:transposase